MAATNYTPIQLYRTATASTTAPAAGNLAFGELAINYNDGGMILYAKKRIRQRHQDHEQPGQFEVSNG